MSFSYYTALIRAAVEMAAVDSEIVVRATGVDPFALELALETGENRFTVADKAALRSYFLDLGIFIVNTDVVVGVFQFPALTGASGRRPFREVMGMLAAGVTDVEGLFLAAAALGDEPGSPPRANW